MNTPLTTLEKLEYVGGNLDLFNTPLTSLGKLEYVGGNLDFEGTPISIKYSEKEIREMVDVKGDIYM